MALNVIRPVVLGTGFASYEVALSSSITGTDDVFLPHDGWMTLTIKGTWAGTITIERRLISDTTWDTVGTYQAITVRNALVAGGEQYYYRARFTTVSSGTPIIRLSQGVEG